MAFHQHVNFLHLLITSSLLTDVVEARWQQPASVQVQSQHTSKANIPSLFDLNLQAPMQSRFAPNDDVSLPAPLLPTPNIPPRHLPLPPPSSLPTGVLQPGPSGPGLLSASATGKRPGLLPLPDMNLISSVPPPPLGLMNVTDEPLLPFPPSAASAFNPDYVSETEYYSAYLDQAGHPTENTSSYTTGYSALPTSMSSAGTHYEVGSLGSMSLSDNAAVERDGEAKPQMTKTARDREARAKKKQRKLQMEPLSVESFLSLSVSKPGAEDIPERVKKADRRTSEVKSEETDSAAAQCLKEDAEEETGGAAEDVPVSIIIIDDPALPREETADAGIVVEAKEYHFDWDSMDDDQVSDVSVSSVHTSDLSSFDDDVEQSASPDTQTDHLAVSDSSPVKDSQLEKSYSESGGELYSCMGLFCC